MPNKKLQVLVIDDSPADAGLITRELRKNFAPVEVERVDTANALQAALRLSHWDVVISDNRMPNFSGTEALQLVKGQEPDLPFILVSGMLGDEAAVEALKASVDDYVLKDNLERLGTVLERKLREAERRRRCSFDVLHESEQRFRQLAENIDPCFYLTDPETHRVFYASPAYEKIWGRSLVSLYADPRSWYSAVHPDDRNEMVERVALAARGVVEARYRIVRPDGAVRWIRSRRFPVRDRSGALYRLAGIVEDVTERKEAEDKLTRLNRVYAVLSGINALIVRVQDRDELFRGACRIAVEAGKFPKAWIGTVEPDSQAVKVAAGHGADAHFFENLGAMLNNDTPQGSGVVACAIRQRQVVISNDLEHDTRVLGAEHAAATGSRSLVVLPLIVANDIAGVLVLHADVSGFFDDEEMRLLTELAGDISFALDHIGKAERLTYLAYYDSLTGLANGTLFLERIAEHIRTADANRKKFALCMFDVERFKTINDTFGRQAGDALLRQIAERMTRAIGEPALLGRVGADAFGLLIPEVQNEDGAARQLENTLHACFGMPFKIEEQELRISAKAGLALFPSDGTHERMLFANAESAWKKAKKTGDRYLFYTERMTEAVAQNLRLENKLRLALERNEFVLHYQPKVNLETGRIVGVEALIRWQSAELGLVPPMQFIPLMEETGLILDVGAWALRQASLDHRRWVEQGLPAPRVAVNVSAMQLRQRDFVSVVADAIKHGVTPHAIDIEITESLLMDDIECNIERLKALRALGVRLAIDDFGTGHSSLAYLAKLPVDTIKIDRSFIITMIDNPDTMTLVRMMIALGHSLRLTVVAEGVDAEEQAKMLRLLHCDELQGYLVGKPLPISGMIALLNAAQA